MSSVGRVVLSREGCLELGGVSGVGRGVWSREQCVWNRGRCLEQGGGSPVQTIC